MTDHGPLVVSLLAPTFDAFHAALAKGAADRADLVELRLDRVAPGVLADPTGIASIVAHARRPVIAAIHGAEGFGGFAGTV
ncbi:MAG: hypothetical protein AAGA20_22665, partial [Planctomycetota bacterium]